jgi:hypothetical protein
VRTTDTKFPDARSWHMDLDLSGQETEYLLKDPSVKERGTGT